MSNSRYKNAAIDSNLSVDRFGVTNSLKIFLAIQDNKLCQQVKLFLTSQGFDAFDALKATTNSNTSILECIRKIRPYILILESPWCNNIDTLEIALKIREEDKNFPIILVTTRGSEALAISALRAGLNDYFASPLPLQLLNERVNQCITNYRLQLTNIKNQPPPTHYEGDHFIGESALMHKVKSNLQKIAFVDSQVLITGETGTGKELIAKYIHQHSTRKNKPFIAINCAAIPEGLLESELFGYEKGAFTGAHSNYLGKLKLADGGSVFFDEIGDMSSCSQAKILRVIENQEVYPLGGKRSLPLDIRIIAATNCDLENKILKKEFREDLYFRLNVARVRLPPLRERKEDIPCLVEYFLRKYNEHSVTEHPGFSDKAWELLVNYDWPGNIRELKNVLEASYINLDSGRIDIESLSDLIRVPRKQEKLLCAEHELLLSTLNSVHWNKSKAAEKLQWSRMKLYRKIAKYHILDEA